MKKLIIAMSIIVFGNCFSQMVTPIYNTDKDQEGVYYKDTFNDYDKFAGTWKYTNGTTSLTIVLQKKLRQTIYDNNLNYEMDFIIGGYRYIENGIEKINTIAQLSQNLPHVIDYYIDGYTIAGSNSIYCFDCETNDRVLFLGFTGPNKDIFLMESEMLFKRVDSGGVEKLELNFRMVSAPPIDVDVPETGNSNYSVPFGKYILTKIN